MEGAKSNDFKLALKEGKFHVVFIEKDTIITVYQNGKKLAFESLNAAESALNELRRLYEDDV